MKHYLSTLSLFSTLMFVAPRGVAQPLFVNLDFELARVPVVPTGQFGQNVAVTNGLPGWMAFIDGSKVDNILHNNVAIGGAAISLFGPNWFPDSPEYIP